MLRKLVPVFLFALLLPGAAAAQGAQGGVYLELRAGAVFLNDLELDDNFLDEGETDTGWLVDGAVGYAHDSGLRGELALGYRRNELDELTAGAISADAEGDISAFTAMANGYYDFHLDKYGARGAAANLTPFIGAGAGVAVVTAKIDEVGGVDIGDDRDSDAVFAYQGIAGLSYAFTPNIAASVSYAYFATTDPNFDGAKVDYSSHNVIAGFRYTF